MGVDLRSMLAHAVLWGACVSVSASGLRFEDGTANSGIDFKHSYGAEELTNLVQTTGPGVCVFDANGDGAPDLYLLNGRQWDEGAEPVLRNALYLNDGKGVFRDATEEAGVGDTGMGMAAAAADIDNDGDEDLYVFNFGANVLYLNRGDGSFEDVTAQAGVACEVWSAAGGFVDVNGDGYLDLFVANYLIFEEDNQPRRSMMSLKEGYRFFPGPYDFPGDSNSLFINNGDGSFRDASAESGIQRVGKGMGCTFSDLDLDGDVDLIIANDRYANFLYENDGSGVFQEVAVQADIAFDMNGFETGAMAVASGDMDEDGYPDLFITNMIFEYNTYYRNKHDLSFEDVTERAALHHGSYQTVGWGVNLADFDRDGDLDAFVANGHVQDYIDTFSESIEYAQRNLLFENHGGGKFAEAADAGAALDVHQVSRGSAIADLDGDGLPDLVVVNSNDAPQILLNRCESPGNWLRVQLQGVRANRQGLGAKLRVTAGGKTVLREVCATSGYASQSDPYPFIGLGDAQSVERLEIDWPGGGRDVYTNLPINSNLLSIQAAGLRPLDETDIQWTPEEAP